MVEAEEVAAMVRLHELGWGAKRLSKEFGCARNTVRRYLRAGGSAPLRKPERKTAFDGMEDWQRERFFRPFLEDDAFLLGGGITEPNAGSDNRLPPPDDPRSGLRLRAERRGDEWILNGEKCYIANANVGKLFFAYTRTDPGAAVSDGTSIFAVPIDTPGLRVGKVFDKSGWRFYQNAELIFENARVPHENLLGEVNSGLKARGGKNAKFGLLEYAANAVGVCDACAESCFACAA